MAEQRESRTAPFYPVPPRRLLSVEHPAIVQNIDKAIDSLQGNAGIKKILTPAKADTPANLVLRPEDAMARPLQSTSSPSNNVLLRVTVPKRTGRKRKRGSDEPFTGPTTNGDADGDAEAATQPRQRRSARDLLRSLQDNALNYQVEAIGRVERTHVFRGMPDFVFSTTGSSFTKRFREQILPYDLDKLKQFDIDMSKGAIRDVDIIPPPSFSHGDVPFHYIYRQNPTVKQSVGQSGEVMTVNTQQATKVFTHLVSYDMPTAPSQPHESCSPIDTLDISLRETIAAVKELFEERPAWTRRALRNSLTKDEQRTLLRHAIPYVGYIFRSGPWRDAIVKLGIDPRSSPGYRHYQTFMFRILPREPELARDGAGGRRHNLPRTEDAIDTSAASEQGRLDTHVFTGQPPLPRDGRIWMACDIKDPQLAAALYPPPATKKASDFLRHTCEIISDGWFGNGTIAKVKTVMRAKIAALIDDRPPREADFRRVLQFPDHARSDADLAAFTLDSEPGVSGKEISLATEIRSTMKSAPSWTRTDVSAGVGVGAEKGVGRETGRGRGGRGRSKKEEKEDEQEVDVEQSEGEEEAMERAEILEAQVAAAVAAREAVEEDDEDEEEGSDNDEGDDTNERDENGDVEMEDDGRE